MLADVLRMIKGFVLFIGPSAAGKTSILRRLVTGEFEEQEPTLGIFEENIKKIRVIEIGGQKSLREYWSVAIDQKPLWIFYVIDVTKKEDYSEYKEFVAEYSKQNPLVMNKTTLTANKVDLTDSMPTYLDEHRYYIQCSAKTGEGMLDVLEIIANIESPEE